MKIKKPIRLLAVSAIVAAPGMVLAEAPDTDTQALLDRISELENKVSVLEATSGTTSEKSHWLDNDQTENVRALVYETLADADTRASLLGNGGTAGWDNGFYLSSGDDSFLLKISGGSQFQYIFNHRAEAASTSVDDADRGGFEVRRSWLKFMGNVFDKDTHFNVLAIYDRDGGATGGNLILYDAFVKRTYDGGWAFQAGQYKPKFYQEFVNSFTNLMPVDRSLVSYVYSGGRTQGIEVSNTSDQMRFFLSFTDGFGQQNNDWSTDDTDFAFLGRVEFLAMGDNWGQFIDAVSFPGTEDHLMFGAAAGYQVGEYGGPTVAETETLRWTVDGTYKSDGWNVFATFLGNHTDDGTLNYDEYAFVVQGGVFLNEDIQVFGRWEWGDADGLASDELSILTLGFTKFWHQHGLKWTTDAGFGLNEVGSYYARDGAGWQTDDAGKDGQVVIRSGLQFQF